MVWNSSGCSEEEEDLGIILWYAAFMHLLAYLYRPIYTQALLKLLLILVILLINNTPSITSIHVALCEGGIKQRIV